MEITKKRTIFTAIIILLLALALFFGIRLLPQMNYVVKSSPEFNDPSVQLSAIETIADETTPLASAPGEQTVQLVTILSEEQAILPKLGNVEASVILPVSEAPAAEEPAAQEPAAEEPAAEEPAAEEPAEDADAEEPAEEEPVTPVVVSTAALRLLERANTLLTKFYACTTTAEKRALLNATNNSLGNDAMRTKLLADLGGSWETLETEVVEATEYQQSKTLYVQVYMSGVGSDFVPVVYTTQNSDRSGNQWATNLVYDDETGTWMEYVKKHPSNNSREGFYMTTLAGEGDKYDALKDTMETSDLWQEVIVPEETATDPAAGEALTGDAAPSEEEPAVIPEVVVEG